MRHRITSLIIVLAVLTACTGSDKPDLKRWGQWNKGEKGDTPVTYIDFSRAHDGFKPEDYPSLIAYAAPPSDPSPAPAPPAAAAPTPATAAPPPATPPAKPPPAPPVTPAAALEVIDKTKADITLVFSVAKSETYHPADRIVRLSIEMWPAEGYEFESYKIAATQLQTTSIGTLDHKVENTMSGSINPTLAGIVKGAFTAQAGTDQTTDAQTTISSQTINQGIDITPDELRIFRESDRGADLAGNILLNLAIAGKADRFERQGWYYFVKSSDLDLDPKQTNLTLAKLHLLPFRSIKTKVQFKYLLRHVTDHYDTYDESDDTVQFFEVTRGLKLPTKAADDSGRVDIADLVYPSAERKAYRQLKLKGTDCHLTTMGEPDLPGELVFANGYEAAKMRTWLLLSHTMSAGKYTLAWDGKGCVPPAGHAVEIESIQVDGLYGVIPDQAAEE